MDAILSRSEYVNGCKPIYLYYIHLWYDFLLLMTSHPFGDRTFVAIMLTWQAGHRHQVGPCFNIKTALSSMGFPIIKTRNCDYIHNRNNPHPNPTSNTIPNYVWVWETSGGRQPVVFIFIDGFVFSRSWRVISMYGLWREFIEPGRIYASVMTVNGIIIGLHTGLSSVWRRAIIWTNAALLSIGF